MNKFKELNQKIKHRFDIIQQQCSILYRVGVEGNILWNIYLNSFSPGDNPVFRDPNSSEHNCNNDKNFIRRYGNVVGINDKTLEIMTMFDLNLEKSDTYFKPMLKLSSEIKSKPIVSVFLESVEMLNKTNYEKIDKKGQNKYQLGNSHTNKIYTQEECDKFGVVVPDKVYTFYHFNISADKKHIVENKLDTKLQDLNTNTQVLKRGLEDISIDTLQQVIELIEQNSILNGQSKLILVKAFLKIKLQYDKLDEQLKNNFIWKQCYNSSISRFRNDLIGVLCQEIENGDLEESITNWNKRVDPINYMRVEKPVTNTQKLKAKEFVENSGYLESFNRTFLSLEDIKTENILHLNSNNNNIKTVNIFDNIPVKDNNNIDITKIKNIQEVNINDFMSKLSEYKSVEMYFENRLCNNLVTMTKPQQENSKLIFKWSNNYSWTFCNNLSTTSMIEKKVKQLGGKTDGYINCRLAWNEHNNCLSDLDLHCTIKHLNTDRTLDEISYLVKCGNLKRGCLDVDIRNPVGLAVENITFNEASNLVDGKYLFYVHLFSNRSSNNAFKAELKIGDTTYCYCSEDKFIKNRTSIVNIAEITVKNKRVVEVKHFLDNNEFGKTYWNINTGQFHKVNLICLSPNYWSDRPVGNKHYFFMIEGCYPSEPVRTFHNEFLNSDLYEHRKTLDILADITMIQPDKSALSGIGFNSTVSNNVTLRVTDFNNKKQIIKVII